MPAQAEIVKRAEVMRSILVVDRTTSNLLFHIPANSSGGINLEVASAVVFGDMRARRKNPLNYRIFVETTEEECRPLFDAVDTLKQSQTISSRVMTPKKARLGYIDSDNTTHREKQILALVDEGHGNKAIATKLNISKSSVKFHLTNLFQKFGVRKRGELARLLNDGYREGQDELTQTLKLPEGATNVTTSDEDSSRAAG
jgi:DNA-binding CsgD family transcriptional regulator